MNSLIANKELTINERNEIIVSDEKAFRNFPSNVIKIFELISRFNCEENINIPEVIIKKAFNNYDLKTFFDFLRNLVEYELPGIDKGFIFLKKIGFLKKIIPELDALEQINQSEKHHAEGNVWNHTLMVVKNILKNKENRFIYLMAGLYHDIGKLETTSWNNKNDDISSYNHENIGAHRLNYYIKGLIPNKEFYQIYALVKNHMLDPQEFKPITCREKARIFHNYCINWKMIMDLRLADRLGRISDDLEKDIENHKKGIERLKKLGIYDL